MLSTQQWMKLQNEMKIQWQQCIDEGLAVEEYEQLCTELTDSDEDREGEAIRLYEKMLTCPVCSDYSYVEPSDYEGIKAASSGYFPKFNKEPSCEILRDKINGAWTGRIFGCLLGKPIEGWRRDRLLPLLKKTDNYPLHKYIEKKDFTDELIAELKIDPDACWRDNAGDVTPADDDTNYTVFAMKLIETYGIDFTPSDVMEGWLRWIPLISTCTAERVAYRNAANGLIPPYTATCNNPYREWVGAQIRGDFFGYIAPGNPEKAAEYAFRDGSISHIKNGIYGEMWVAAMHAAASVCDNMTDVIAAGLAVIPQKCRLCEDIKTVLDWHKQGISAAEAIELIHERYDEKFEHDWCHTNSNAMIVAIGLLWGNNDFAFSICLAVQAAFDTDCNGATVGSIMGMFLGSSGISEKWAFTDKLQTSIDGYNVVTISQLTKKTMELINK